MPESGRRREAGTGGDEPAQPKTERSRVPGVSFEDADRCIERHRGERPWLQMPAGASPQVRRIIASADMTGGRAAYLENPAQLDPDKRRCGIDGLKPGASPKHVCADLAARITSPDAYAAASALGGTLHPDAQAALNAVLTAVAWCLGWPAQHRPR